MNDKPLSEQSPVKLGLVIAVLCGVAWSLGKWTDFADKYQTKELAAAQATVLETKIDAVKETLSAQLEALRAEIRASDRGGK